MGTYMSALLSRGSLIGDGEVCMWGWWYGESALRSAALAPILP